MRIALGIASTALEVGESRGRTEHVWLKLWDDHDQPAGRTNQSKSAPILDEASDERHGASRVDVEQLDQQMQRDIKRVNLGLPGDLQLQGMQQVCQNEGQPQLDQHQFGACPNTVQIRRKERNETPRRVRWHTRSHQHSEKGARLMITTIRQTIEEGTAIHGGG